MLKTNTTIESKQKLLIAGLELFAMNGFDGTSTRQICEKAGVNISLIPYYFNNKEGLYNSVIETIAKKVFMQVEPIIKKIEIVDNISKEEAKILFNQIIEVFSEFILSKEIPNSFPVLIIREQTEPTAAFEILYETAIKHIHRTFRKLIGVLVNKEESDPEVIFRVSSIIGQIISFRMNKQAILRALGQNDLTEENIKLIKKIILNQTDAIISSAGGSL